MYRIRIAKGKDKQLQKHHPWVFSGAVDKVIPSFTTGDWAEVYSAEGTFIAKGWYDEKSHIILHLLTWDADEAVDDDFVRTLVKKAVLRRKEFFSTSDATAFRLIHGEADFIPGVAADCYGREIRLIISSRFADHFLPVMVETLESMLHPSRIQVTADSFYASSEGLSEKVRYFIGGEEVQENSFVHNNVQFVESGIWYEAAPGKGQKSGFYCDQRENRKAIEKYVSGKKVLDVCSYTGGFTLHSLKAGAASVDAVDSSESALRHLLYQIHLNENKGVLPEGSRDKVTITDTDAFDFVRTIEEDKYDVIILDPPKLAQTKGKLENATKAYKDLNRVAMLKIKDGGTIATFSCSGAMTRENFQLTLAWAAADAGVEIQILETLSAGSDHPVRLSFPESAYLKGFIIRVIKH
ncbi:MAG: class I SAM-dependent rRNA methyltransferase [Spirochaetales bacterium]|nr:class I SAM-dependent rRNA methyltransferase [Candidatus Physcosoma equi]